MFKLGDKVRVSPDNRWYETTGDSPGTVVAIPDDKYGDYRVVFKYEDFLNDEFWRLHNCDTPTSYEVDMEYFENTGRKYRLKWNHKGYNIEQDGLLLAKRGNRSLFR